MVFKSLNFRFTVSIYITGESTAFRYWDHIPQGQFLDYKDCAMMLIGKHGHWVQHSCTGFLFNPEQHGYVCEYGMI